MRLIRPVLVALSIAGVALATTASAGGPAAPNTLSESEKKAGFKLLFDGKTTDGWRSYKQQQISDKWQVVDGALTRAEKGAGDIVTKDQYSAFELLIDWKIAPGGNSAGF